MGMKPIFIISFDCEGKWGMADCITDHHQHHFTEENIAYVYRKILSLLDKYELVATFAFVGLFSLSVDEYKKNFNLHNVSVAHYRWLQAFLDDEKREIWEGWFSPKAFDMVRNNRKHEIASHGFTHIPLASSLVSSEVMKYELDNMKKIAEIKGVENKTLVYPRNLIGYPDKLKDYKIIGYRNCLASKMLPIFNLAREFNILQHAHQFNIAITDDCVVIPAGYMLNWRASMRKTIPMFVTKLRWQHIVRDAIENTKVVHLWTHPHNFIDGSDQFKLFEEVLKDFSSFVRNGELMNMAQKEYCELMLSVVAQSN